MTVADPLHDFPDRAIRQLLLYPQHLRSLLRRVVPHLADRFDCGRAQLLQREFPLDDWRGRESDLFFLIPYRTDEGEQWALVCVLIEHQSQADPRMPLRTLLYAVLFWEREWKRWEEQAPPRPPFRLTPVLPIVFHTAPRPWGSNRRLADLLAGPAEFHAYAPAWEPLFWDLAALTPRELLDSPEEWLQALAVVRVENESGEEFERVYKEVIRRLEPLFATERVRWYDLVRTILTWGLWRRPRGEGDRLLKAAVASQQDAALNKEMQSMTQTLGQWYVEQGKKAGLEEGKRVGLEEGKKVGLEEGKIEGQLRALRETLRFQLEDRFQTVPEPLLQRIEAATDPMRLRSCLRQVMHIRSPEELQL